MDLHPVDQVSVERRLQHGAHLGMVVSEARKPLAGVKIEVGAAVAVVEVGALGRPIGPVEAEDPQHVNERRIEVARGQAQGLAGARSRVAGDAERIGNRTGL